MTRELAHTLGIDLASQPDTTGVCLLAWHPDRVEVPYLVRGHDAAGPLDDDRLVELMSVGLGPGTAPEKIGIDAPLGWPVAFVTAVAAPEAWPLAEEVPPVAMVRRLADRWVHAQTGKLPLSVSADRIAYPAMRAQRLLRRYAADGGRSVDRSGQHGAICEVYPDPGVTNFGLRPPGARRLTYKGAAGIDMRRRLVSALVLAAPWLVLTEHQQADCIAHDDVFDALIAALITRAVVLGLTEPPPAEMAADAAREGWIHLPRPGGLVGLKPPRA